MIKVFTNCSIFDGNTFLGNKAVVVKGNKIIDVIPKSKIAGYDELIDCEGDILAPGFIDCQVNGGGGAFYTQKPNVSDYEVVNAAHREFGTTSLLPTIISTSLDNIIESLKVAKEMMKDPSSGVLGMHVEGPFFNPEKKGAHSLDFIREASDYEIDKILEHGVGVIKILTLAPEMVSPEHIKKLIDAGIPVSAGHSNTTYEQAMKGFDLG